MSIKNGSVSLDGQRIMHKSRRGIRDVIRSSSSSLRPAFD